MHRRRYFSACAILVLALASPIAAQSPTKKLIEFGWDRPTAPFLATNATAMDNRPFDGVVIQFRAGYRIFVRSVLDSALFEADLADLNKFHLTRLTDNFVLVEVAADSGWSWFDDGQWKVAEVNLRRFVSTAKRGGLAGILLDVEPYGVNLWKYPQPGKDATQPFDSVQAQVRRRGREFMVAAQQEFPGLLIFAPYLLSYSQSVLDIADSVKRNVALRGNVWALEPAFVAGMLEAAAGTTSITDGNEGSYWYADSTAFNVGARAIKEGAQTLVPPELRPAYRQRVRVGQAIFADYLLGMYTWGPDTVAKHVAPADRMKRLEYNVYHALRNADEYVWIYSQKMNWWKQDSLPPGLAEAVERAARAANSGAPLGFGPPDFIR